MYADTANNIARIYENEGNAQAALAQQRGQIWGQTLASLGGQIAQIPQQIQQRKLQDLQLQTGQMELQQHQQQILAQRALDEEMRTALNPDGSFNRDALQKGVINRGLGHLWPAMDKQFTESDKLHGEVAKLQNDIADKQQDAWGAFGAAVRDANYDPGTFTTMLAAQVRRGYLPKDEAAQYLTQLQQDPSQLKPLVDHLIAGSPAQQKIGAERMTAESRARQATTGETRLNLETPGIAAKGAVEQQVAAGTVGGLTPDQQQTLALREKALGLEAGTLSVRRGQLAVAQQREHREGAAQNTPLDLTPAGLDTAALNYLKTGQLPPLGMGDKTTRKGIINRAAELGNGTGDPLRTSLDLASNRAGFASNEASLKSIQKSRDAVSAFENTALKNIDIFLDTAGKVVDTGSPMANSVARSLSGKVLGSSNQAAYDAARQVALNEIAKVVSNPNLGGQLSDSARKEVEAFNPNTATLKQSVAVMRILKQDMANRASSYDAQIAEIKGRIANAPAAPAANGPKATLRFNPATGKLEPVQ